MRARLLVIVPAAALAVALVAFAVTLFATGSQADANPSGVVTVGVSELPVGGITTRLVAIPGLHQSHWPVYVVRETTNSYLALLGRGPRVSCRVVRADDRHYDHLTNAPQVKFDDPCGAAFYTLSGECFAGPCNRGLDRFAVSVTDGKARVDLNQLTPGQPRARW